MVMQMLQACVANPADGTLHMFRSAGDTWTYVGHLNTTFNDVGKERFVTYELDGAVLAVVASQSKSIFYIDTSAGETHWLHHVHDANQSKATLVLGSRVDHILRIYNTSHGTTRMLCDLIYADYDAPDGRTVPVCLFLFL